MKNVIQKLAFVAMVTLPTLMMAQPMPGDTSGFPVGGGGSAPIDGGLFILLSFAAGYGAKKVYNSRKKVLD